MKLLIKIPTRERGFDWLHSYLDNITNPETRVLLTLDNDDNWQQNLVHFWDLPENYLYQDKVIVREAFSGDKIKAINRDINGLGNDWDILMVGSDDMIPQVKGFDQIIIDDMKANYPDTDGCLWYHTEDWESELRRRRVRNASPGNYVFLNNWICMLPVIGKTYYERFNYVYHPSYKSFFCDNEFTKVAVQKKKITYIHSQIVKHLHPAWDKRGKTDELYSRNDKKWNYDHKNYNTRRRRGFPTT